MPCSPGGPPASSPFSPAVGWGRAVTDSSGPLWEHQATGRVLTTAACEGAGPAVWKRPSDQTEYKQAAPREVRVSPGFPTPSIPGSSFPSCPEGPGLPAALHQVSASTPSGEAFPDHLPRLHICPWLFLIRPGPHPLSKVALEGVRTQTFGQGWQPSRDCLEERREAASGSEPGG